MDYPTALHQVMSLVDMERTLGDPTHQPRYDLSRMVDLLRRLGDPQARTPTVHVTGTKGKGSTCAMITSILAQSGYAVGLYTSPHLHTLRERIRLGLTPISESQFASLVERVWPAVEEVRGEEAYGRVTTFELLTALAFLYFAEQRREIQVLEVGLGGTLDATNAVKSPLVCVLTPISLDHTNILGNSVEEIARDKSGIIKKGAIVVAGPQPPGAMTVIERACQAQGAPLVKAAETYRWEAGPRDLEGQSFTITGPLDRCELWMPLLGVHQIENACGALAAVEALAKRGFAVSRGAIQAGFQKVQWPARLEVLRREPLVLADGAHNPASMGRLAEDVRHRFGSRRCILVLGCTRGHDLAGVVAQAVALKPALVLATRSRHPRAVPPATVAQALQLFGMTALETETVASAMERALEQAGTDDLVLCTGSLFTAAEAREHLLGISGEVYPELQRETFPARAM